MKKIIQALSKSLAIDILFLLKNGKELRYSEIKKLGHYTTVSRRLKELEKLKLLKREVKAEYPPRVTYRLTRAGHKIIKVLEEIEKSI
jgi:DNA-binding HxlR family transcriptional regulator